jgi:hypothetical protein
VGLYLFFRKNGEIKYNAMKRYEIINRVIESKGYTDYLEIGVRDGECFREICCKNKTGVDPNSTSDHTTHIMTSDSFFNELHENDMFDVIFIDGLHLDHQVNKDIANSLKHLREGGTILLHDCNPPTRYHAGESPVFTEPANGEWNGTVYLSLINLRLYKNNLELKTVDSDWGVGILTRGVSETLNVFPNDAMNWEFFYENKNEILNLISVNEFSDTYPIDLLVD